jgi:integrase
MLLEEKAVTVHTSTNVPATVNELCDRYQAWADEYYRLPDRNGKRRLTGESFNMRDAMRAIRAVAGDKPPGDVMAEDLCACQQWMVDQANLSRETINARVNRIRRVFRWATRPPHRWVPLHVLVDLQLVEPLSWGRTRAKESSPVEPVAWEHVTATMAVAPPQIYTMLDLHWSTGMRPGELVRIRRSELTVEQPRLATGGSVEVMVYRPSEHKTRHYGLDRNVFLGPEARRLVEDWMRRVPTDRLFDYSTNTYRQAIARLNEKHGIPHWSPNQIRHAFATRIRSTSGIDVVQVLMGHRRRTTTEIYAKPDCSAAIEAIARFG